MYYVVINLMKKQKIFKSIVNSTDSSEYKKQGLRMFNRGYIEQAMKCFWEKWRLRFTQKSISKYDS